MVHPDHRRQGTGRELLRHAAGRAAAAERVVLAGYARDESPGAAFAALGGATAGQAEVRRVLDLRKMPAGEVAALRGDGGGPPRDTRW